MSNNEFENAFHHLCALFNGADDMIQEYNLLLLYMKKNPPKIPEKSSVWQEVKDLKPLLINQLIWSATRRTFFVTERKLLLETTA